MTHSTNHNPEPIGDRIDRLLHAVEKHRLMFLYWAEACRRNPHTAHRPSGVNERVERDEIRGWHAMVDDIDADGSFLLRHSDTLNRYAQAAIARFGPGDGFPPTELNAANQAVASEGGSLPYWSLDDGAMEYLERSSKDVQEACSALAQVPGWPTLSKVAIETEELARPANHPRWYPDIKIGWGYLERLDQGIRHLQRALVEVASESGTESPSKQAALDPQLIADLATLWLLCRDLEEVRRDYPDALQPVEYEKLKAKLDALLTFILGKPGFERLQEFSQGRKLLGEGPWRQYEALMLLALAHHPSCVESDGSDAGTYKALSKTLEQCLKSASAAVQSLKMQIATIMTFSCRCPTGVDNDEFANPARAHHMLRRYWTLAAMILQLQANVGIGWQPHPLLSLVENLRDRVKLCFPLLASVEDAANAREAADLLLRMLSEDDPGDLAAVPEWTSSEIQKVERFIARAGLAIGVREFKLTAAERLFVKEAESSIAQYEQDVLKARASIMGSAQQSQASDQPAGAPRSPMSAEEQVGQMLSHLAQTDSRILSLGPRLKSLGARGSQVESFAHTSQVQRQLQVWIDPIVAGLKEAEELSRGVGQHLSDYLRDASQWEVDTRLAIRRVKDAVFGLIHSNGCEREEQLMHDVYDGLYDRGQQLQAAWEAIAARVATPHKNSVVERVPSSSGMPSVALGRPGEPCSVNGKAKRALTDGQHAVIEALINAGESGLGKDALEAVRRSARRMLDDLREDPDWAAVILMPGQTNGRYRIRL